jgi:hypothetical protein
MKRFIEGVERTPSTLFPARLDDYITEDNTVRVIDAFVDTRNLKVLGFGGTVPAATGRPPYHPAVLLKIYIDGYLNRIQSILACDQQGVIPLVPKPATSNRRALGLFDRRDFLYLAPSDAYLCPAGQRAPWRFRTLENGRVLAKYWSSACPSCAMKPMCTTGDYRRITRWEPEAVLERMQQRMDRRPELAMRRRCTVEHPFGTLKA